MQEIIRKRSTLILSFCWFLGLCCGVFSARAASSVVRPMIADAVAQIPYLWGIVTADMFPFLLSAFGVSFSGSYLFPISFFKAFSFGFCAAGAGLIYGNGGWLIRILFLFSDIVLIPILFVYWIRCLSGHDRARRDLIICLVISLIVGMTDRFLISPFLVSLV